MIISIVLFLIEKIIKAIIVIAHNTLPQIEIGQQLFSFISTILSVTQQALNFMYLLFGETLFLIMPLIVSLLTFKYIAYPIIQIIRSLFINSNE